MLQGVVVNMLWNVVLCFVLSIRNAVFRTFLHLSMKTIWHNAHLYLPFNDLKVCAPVGNHSQNSDSSDWKLKRENTPILTQFPSLCSPWWYPSIEPLCRLSTHCLLCPVARGGVVSALLALRHRNRSASSLRETHCILIVGLLIKISLCLPTFQEHWHRTSTSL